MSQNIKDTNKIIDAILGALTTANAIMPTAVPGIAAVKSIFKSGLKTGKSIEEMEAEAADTIATEMRTRAKSEDQMSDRP